jgi:RNA polymerase sigma-70 factor (ECF subfamily)
MEDVLDARTLGADDGEYWDAEIAEAAKTDSYAFAELYERYYPRVYRYTYHRVAHLSDAEDITALVFMKALESLPSYQSRRNTFAPWLFRIARNAIIDYYRRRRSHSPLDDVAGFRAEGDPASHALSQERHEEMMALLQHLSEDQREVVLLKFAGDLTYAEIAATMKKNEPAVRMLLHRGLRKLKDVMEHA